MVLVAIFVGLPLIAVTCTVIFGLFDSSNSHDVPDSQINGGLTDSQYEQVADALTTQAVERNWCYKRDGSLDSARMAYVTAPRRVSTPTALILITDFLKEECVATWGRAIASKPAFSNFGTEG